MSERIAKVGSIDSLRLFRAAMLKFAEAANIALADAEGEISHTMSWLEGEQEAHWRSQVRKRSEIVNRAKDAVRQKKLYRDSTGRQQSAIDEEKALVIAQRRLSEAEQKLANVRSSRNRLRREIDQYKGAVQRLATTVQQDIPVAAAKLEKMMTSLEAYVDLAAPDTEPTAPQPASEATAPPAASEADETKPTDETWD